MSTRQQSSGKIVVIGAGLAGLTAASRLAEAYGSRVLLLERESFTGGMAHTFSDGDISYDFGSHRIHPAYDPAALALIRDLIGSDLKLRDRRGKLRLNGRYMNYPPDLPGFLKGLGIGASLRGAASFLAERLRPSHGDGVPLSYETCMTRRAGKVIYDLFYSPYAWKVYGIDPKTISAHAAKIRVSLKKPLAVARDLLLPKKAEKKFFYYPYRGIGSIPDELQRRFLQSGGELLTDVAIRAVGIRSGRVRELVFRHGGAETSVPVEVLIPTIPVNDLVALFSPRPAGAIADGARALRWRAIRFLYLCIRRDFCCESETYYFPETRFHFGRISEPKRFSPHMVRVDGRTVLCIEVLCNVADPFWSMPDAALLRRLIHDLRQLGLVTSMKEIDRIFSRRLPAIYPIYDLAWERNFETARRFLDGIPNLYPIGRGSLFLHDNMDHALRMGQEVAQFIIGNRDGRAWPEVAASFRHFEVRD